ncbi:hypothetical protein FQN57_001963 [Myotisia sp. PD_48]|nr:hypothetical protein FQN57_001963 [Myotisia sp. PD_48]
MKETVYVVPVGDDGSPATQHGYITLPPPTDPPYVVRFLLEGSSPITRKGSLWVLIGSKVSAWNANSIIYGLDPTFNRDLKIDIPIIFAGAFSFYFTYHSVPDLSAPKSQPGTETTLRSQTHYINVCPVIQLNEDVLPVTALSVFSVISKFMGQYPVDWDKYLQGISDRGYNMIHFTPLTQRGTSNSPYSVYDQLKFDNICFPNGEQDLAELVARMESKYRLLALTDVVWNHTANNSKLLESNPEVGYNIINSPWLEAALVLDDALLQYGQDLGSFGLPTEFNSIDDLSAVMGQLKPRVIEKIKLWEFYTIDVKRDSENTIESWKAGRLTFPKGGFGDTGIGGLSEIRVGWSLETKANFLREKALVNSAIISSRYSKAIDPKIGAALLTALYGRYDDTSSDISKITTELQSILDTVNIPLFEEFDQDVTEIHHQIFNRVKYLRLDDNGPKWGPVTKESPFIETYFTRLRLNKTTEKHDPRSLALVNNGWVWNADAMKDHAGKDSRVYLLRQVIIWGDCVKLRYGQAYEDNPFLWDFMSRYSKLMAKYFVGFRIDNCHSTPLNVAEFLLDEARKVRPNLIVFAELFTGSEETDYVFAKRLGLTALIREAMQAWNAAELSRLVHRHGGRPIGSFDMGLLCHKAHWKESQTIIHVESTSLPALFMDCTHDNETPNEKREARDTLPNAALVSMCASATGSVMGYDEIYPEHIDLVNETRLYCPPRDGQFKSITGPGGIGGLRKLLNNLHTRMAIDAFDETHIHHEGEYITVHRVQPSTRKGVLLIARTAFSGSGNGSDLGPIYLSGTRAKELGCWKLHVESNGDTQPEQGYLSGMESLLSDISETNLVEEDGRTVIEPPTEFPPGSIVLLETWIPEEDLPLGPSSYKIASAKEAIKSLDAVDLNFFLYRCDSEERDSTNGQDGVYNIPNFGPLVYAGLQGWWSILEQIIQKNDLGHPLCDNLREGHWAMDFIVGRLKKASSQEKYKKLGESAEWLRQQFDSIRKLPSFLVPRYFTIVVKEAYEAALKHGIHVLGTNIEHGQHFIHELAMVSIQMTGFVKSASLYPTKDVPCLAAGLPHFSIDWARCWGRDVFISFRGLLLCATRYGDAKQHILAFASVVKHGLVPNLLSNGKAPRYNARDSVWFFLQAIQDYTKIVPNGIEILGERVSRRFLPYDDTWFPFDDKRAYSTFSTLGEIIQEILQRHASGISYREHNAGPELDRQMRAEGFQVDVHVNWETGLIFGGNQWNCGTWMDKMGESTKAGNKGYPGTPRDGAAIEITGLLYSTLTWISKLRDEKKYGPEGVDIGQGKSVKFSDWAGKIKTHFERCYYIPTNAADDVHHDIESNIVNRRGIYKDLYKSGKPYEDYQLRPNFTVAMVVAPDLFNPERALNALFNADKLIRGPTGMATLDSGDLNYRPYYDNSNDSTDFATSKGRNYHQGPEWLWPTGYFLRALLKFYLIRRDTPQDRMDIFQQITTRLEACKKSLRASPWKGLTELTNKNGDFCADSSPTQAWSAACLLDLYYDASHLKLA